jgi:hypothetical protein
MAHGAVEPGSPSSCHIIGVTQSHDDHASESINLKEIIKKVNNLTKLLYRGKSIHITNPLFSQHGFGPVRA